MNLSIDARDCDEGSFIRNNKVDSTYKGVDLSSSSLFKLEFILLQRKIDLKIV